MPDALLNEGDTETAPRYAIPARRLGALEHPLLVKDVDKAIQTFGMNPSLQVVRPSLLIISFPITALTIYPDPRLRESANISSAVPAA